MNKLPPHGYEGMRAIRPAVPLAERRTPPDRLPSAEQLARSGITLEQIGNPPAAPVMLRHHGIACGVFSSAERSQPVIRQLTQ